MLRAGPPAVDTLGCVGPVRRGASSEEVRSLGCALGEAVGTLAPSSLFLAVREGHP